jgi:hypothetical protein
MTNKKYNEEEIKKYVGYFFKMTDIKSLEEVDYTLFGKTLKYLADTNKGKDFSVMLDNYLSLVDKSPDENLKKNVYSFLEFLCTGIEKGFTKAYIGLEAWKNPMGNTQKMLKENFQDSDRKK